MRTISTLAAAAALLSLTVPAGAATVTDPAGDFLGSYTGAQNGDLDIRSATAIFDGTDFRLSAQVNGTVGTSVGSLFVFGINRGAGTERLMLGSPAAGSGILFDAVAVLFPDGTGRIATFPAAGAPTITNLPGAITVSGNTISGLFPSALLPSRGFAAQDYGFALWSRLRVNPALDGTNAELADFAPNASNFRATAVPEPGTWAMLLIGFAAVGASLRRGRTALAVPRPV